MTWLWILLIALVIFYFTAGFILARFTMYPKKNRYEDIKSRELSRENGPPVELYDLSGEVLALQSDTGPRLTAHYFRPQNPTGRYVLLNHGYNYPYFGMYKYLPLFLPHGVGVLLPDHRGNGSSDTAPITFGYYEHRDSIAWLDKLREIALSEGFQNPQIGVMGESMGAAVTLLMTAKQPELSFCIADCSYTSWQDILKCRSKYDFHHLVSPFLPSVYLFIRILSGANASEVNVLQAARSITVPTLIIHGEADRYVPYEMGKALAASNPSFQFFTQPGAGHAQSVVKDYPAYEQAVNKFLSQIGFFKEPATFQ